VTAVSGGFSMDIIWFWLLVETALTQLAKIIIGQL
jgi:hypothetical protein